MKKSDKKILLSGIQATGRPHIGNYFGAMKQFVDMQNEYETRIMIADYHALNTVQNPEELRENIIGVALDYIGNRS
jgi:tryptophanyl-tRNA synthetase